MTNQSRQSLESFTDDLKKQIEAAYLRTSNNRIGWRFLTSPVSVLDKSKVAFLGLNPGGDRDTPEHPVFAPKFGSAYVDESWDGYPAGQNPLQKQIRALFDRLGAKPEEVLAGQFVPFRSPSWECLYEKQDCIELGRSLWAKVFRQTRPKLVVTMGKDAIKVISTVLEVEHLEKVACGWGNQSISFATHDDMRFVGLPHLSRFSIINREKSEEGLSIAFGEFWRG